MIKFKFSIAVIDCDGVIVDMKAETHSPKLFPNAKKVLKKLRERDKRICVTSGSKTEDLKDLFGKYELTYDAILGSDNIPKGNGHIEYFAESLGISLKNFCHRAIYLGDGPRDMEIARQNKIFAVGITTTVSKTKLMKAGANTVIKEIREFLEIVS